MDREINFSVLGEGFIGKKHKFFIEQTKDARLLSTIDSVNPESDYSSIKSFVEGDKGETDVVCIATPNGLHGDQAIELLNAGYHVVIEKPMALHKAKATEVVETAQRMDKKVFVVMQNRYSPSAQWLKSLVDSGALGKLYFVQVNCFWNRDGRYYKGTTWHGSKELDGGTLFTQFSHFVDLLYWCFGDFHKIRTRLFDFNHENLTEIEDSGMIGFEFENGGIGQFNYSTSAHQTNLESTLTLLSENASIKIGGQYMDQIIHCSDPNFKPEEVKPFDVQMGPYKGNSANHRFVFDNVVHTLKGTQKEATNAKEGLAVVDIIERIYNAR